MYCESCGAELPSEHTICPICGFQSTEGNEGQPPITRLPKPEKKRFPLFLFLGLGLFGLVLAALYFFFHAQDIDLKEIARNEFHLIREKKIAEAYYTHTSNSFQRETSFGEFKEFLDLYPQLFQEGEIHIDDEQILDGKHQLKLSLAPKNEEIKDLVMLFSFIYEKSHWKIEEIRLYQTIENTPHHEESQEEENQEHPIAPINEFLNLVMAHQLDTAYQETLSKELKQKISIKNFFSFIESHPSLNHMHDFELQDYSQKEGEGKAVLLLDPDTNAETVEFTLVKEGGKWKIFHIHLLTNELPKTLPQINEDRSEANETVFGWLKALKERNYALAYEEYTSVDFRKETKEGDLEEFVASFPLFEDYETAELLEFKLLNDESHIRLLLTKEPMQEEVDFSLEKEGEKWKILGVQVMEK